MICMVIALKLKSNSATNCHEDSVPVLKLSFFFFPFCFFFFYLLYMFILALAFDVINLLLAQNYVNCNERYLYTQFLCKYNFLFPFVNSLLF